MYYYHQVIRPIALYLLLVANLAYIAFDSTLLVKCINLLYVPPCPDLDNAVGILVVTLALALSSAEYCYRELKEADWLY